MRARPFLCVSPRVLPFLAKKSCRRHITSSGLASLPPPEQAVRVGSNVLDESAAPHPAYTSNHTRDTHVDASPVLDELLYRPARERLAKRIPLEAASDILSILRSVPDGHPTPPAIVDEVLHIAESAYPGSKKPRPLEAIYRLAMAIIRPGETSDSADHRPLIARLLRISVGDPEGRYGHYNRPLGALFGTVKCRSGGRRAKTTSILMLADEKDYSKEYTRYIASHHSLFSRTYRISTIYNQESDELKRYALARQYQQAHEDMFYNGKNIATRLHASLYLAQAYAEASVLLRDGEKARCWWARTFDLGWKTVGLDHCDAPAVAARQLALVYLGRQPAVYGQVPLFPRDFTKAFRYLHLAKWKDMKAASLLGKLYDFRSHTVKEHITQYGVIPDDTSAAEAYYIGAERVSDIGSKFRFAQMLCERRAHPPVDPLSVKAPFDPPYPSLPSEQTESADHTGSMEECERAISLYDDTAHPSIEFAPRSRRETLDYAWSLVKPFVGKNVPSHHPLASLPELIAKESDASR